MKGSEIIVITTLVLACFEIALSTSLTHEISIDPTSNEYFELLDFKREDDSGAFDIGTKITAVVRAKKDVYISKSKELTIFLLFVPIIFPIVNENLWIRKGAEHTFVLTYYCETWTCLIAVPLWMMYFNESNQLVFAIQMT